MKNIKQNRTTRVQKKNKEKRNNSKSREKKAEKYPRVTSRLVENGVRGDNNSKTSVSAAVDVAYTSKS